MKTIGIYPGTFDLVHDGHLAFAEAAQRECSLDVVYFAPEKSPRNKSKVSKLQVRTDNIRAAINESSVLDVIELESASFTVSKTLPEIEARLGPATFTLLLGSDVASNINNWPHVETLLSDWHVAIGMRNDDRAEDIETMFKRLEEKYGISVSRTFIYTDKSGLSSSDFRR